MSDEIISLSKNAERKEFPAFYLLFKENSLDEQGEEAMEEEAKAEAGEEEGQG